ncbi:hypothetical protein BGX38DRAFT_1274191 [Terfezia claveryi]|nr:hypothetical protein BGX38DRAFT_1274191 [Terfezia claveryi]
MDEAIQSMERLNLLRQELNNKIEEAHKERKKFADTKDATIGLTMNETPRRQRDFQRKESVEVSPNFSFKREIKPEKTVIKREKTVDADAEGRRDVRDRRGGCGFLKTRNWSPDKESMSGGDEEEDYVDNYEYGRSRRDGYAQGPKRGRGEPKRGREEYRDGRQGSGYYRSERWEGRTGYDDDNSDWYSPESDIVIGVIMVPLDVETSVKEIMIGEGVGKTKREGIEPRERKIGSGQEVEALCLRGNSKGGGTKNYIMIVIDLGGDKGEVNSTTSPVMEDQGEVNQGEVDQGEVGASTVTIPGGDKEQVNSTKSQVMEDKGVRWACYGGRKMLSMNEEVDNDDDLMPE